MKGFFKKRKSESNHDSSNQSSPSLNSTTSSLSSTTSSSNSNSLKAFPLHRETLNGNIENVCNLLKDKKRNINERDAEKRTALYLATMYNKPEIVEILVKSGAETEIRDVEGMTVLHRAIANSYNDIVRILLKFDAVVETRDNEKRTPLHISAYVGDANVGQTILGFNPKLNCKDGEGRTPLHYAVYRNHKDFVKLLLDAGCDKNSKDNGGRTAVTYAANNGCNEILQLLLESGCEADIPDEEGNSAIFYAAHVGTSDCQDCLQTLKKYSKYANNPSILGRTAAAKQSNIANNLALAGIQVSVAVDSEADDKRDSEEEVKKKENRDNLDSAPDRFNDNLMATSIVKHAEVSYKELVETRKNLSTTPTSKQVRSQNFGYNPANNANDNVNDEHHDNNTGSSSKSNSDNDTDSLPSRLISPSPEEKHRSNEIETNIIKPDTSKMKEKEEILIIDDFDEDFDLNIKNNIPQSSIKNVNNNLNNNNNGSNGANAILSSTTTTTTTITTTQATNSSTTSSNPLNIQVVNEEKKPINNNGSNIILTIESQQKSESGIIVKDVDAEVDLKTVSEEDSLQNLNSNSLKPQLIRTSSSSMNTEAVPSKTNTNTKQHQRIEELERTVADYKERIKTKEFECIKINEESTVSRMESTRLRKELEMVKETMTRKETDIELLRKQLSSSLATSKEKEDMDKKLQLKLKDEIAELQSELTKVKSESLLKLNATVKPLIGENMKEPRSEETIKFIKETHRNEIEKNLQDMEKLRKEIDDQKSLIESLQRLHFHQSHQSRDNSNNDSDIKHLPSASTKQQSPISQSQSPFPPHRQQNSNSNIGKFNFLRVNGMLEGENQRLIVEYETAKAEWKEEKIILISIIADLEKKLKECNRRRKDDKKIYVKKVKILQQKQEQQEQEQQVITTTVSNSAIYPNTSSSNCCCFHNLSGFHSNLNRSDNIRLIEDRNNRGKSWSDSKNCNESNINTLGEITYYLDVTTRELEDTKRLLENEKVQRDLERNRYENDRQRLDKIQSSMTIINNNTSPSSAPRTATNLNVSKSYLYSEIDSHSLMSEINQTHSMMILRRQLSDALEDREKYKFAYESMKLNKVSCEAELNAFKEKYYNNKN